MRTKVIIETQWKPTIPPLSVLHTSVAVPYELGFESFTGGMLALNYVVDGFFWLDTTR